MPGEEMGDALHPPPSQGLEGEDAVQTQRGSGWSPCAPRRARVGRDACPWPGWRQLLQQP